MNDKIELIASDAVRSGDLVALDQGYLVYVGPWNGMPNGMRYDKAFMHPADVAVARRLVTGMTTGS